MRSTWDERREPGTRMEAWFAGGDVCFVGPKESKLRKERKGDRDPAALAVGF